MKALAKPFYRAALLGFDHALSHSHVDGEMDAAQVILSLDFGLEMLFKAVLLDRDESILQGNKRSIGLNEALKRCGPYKNGSAAEVLRERRDSLQHFAQYTDASTTRDHIEATMSLVEEVLKQDFGQSLPEGLESKPVRVPVLSAFELVFDSPQLQRDVWASDDGTVVWAQGVEGTSELVVWVKRVGQDAYQLTPKGQFEYMPKSDGQRVVCFRQSGGVIAYDLASKARKVLSETGGAPYVNGPWVAAQGIQIENGLGGGISLWNDDHAKWEHISDGGDTARIDGGSIVWQELGGDKVDIKARKLEGGRISTIASGANHPSPDGEQIAWSEWGNDDWVHVTKLDGSEIYRAPRGFFPSLKGDLLAYLRKTEEGYELSVDDVDRKSNLFVLPSVGFPTGGGPVLAHDELFFESPFGRPVNAIWRTTAKLSDHNNSAEKK
jgi:hypothetical protein